MAPVLFLAITSLLVIRSTNNGMLVLLLIFYTPAITVGLPSIFSVTAGIVVSKFVLVDVLLRRSSIRLNTIIYAAAAFTAFATLMTMFAPKIDLAIPYYLKYIEGLALLTLLHLTVVSKNGLGRVFMWWAVFAGLASVIKAVHIELGQDTALYKMMEEVFMHGEFDVEHRTHINIGGSIARRFLLPGEEPNYVSASLVFPFALALAFFSVGRGYQKLFWLMIGCLVAAGVIGTYSRSGFLAIVLIVFLYLIRGNPLKAIIPAFILGALLLLAVNQIPQLHDRIFGIDKAIKTGATGRFTLWNWAMEMWLQSPVYGNGMSAFYAKHHGAVHNTYLQILAETGVIGLGLFLWVIVAAWLIGIRFRKLSQLRGHAAGASFSQILTAGLLSFCAIIATITFQDVKLFWLACGAFASLHFISAGTPTENVSPPLGAPHGEIIPQRNIGCIP
jgi:hypothetical protein